MIEKVLERVASQNANHTLAPTRSHCPVLTVDYKSIDEESGYGDAHFMDIGQSTWDKSDYSAKVWRWAEKGCRWSRQGEELPLSRVLDLAILVTATVMRKSSVLHEFVQNEPQEEDLRSYLTENMQVFGPKLDEIRRILSQGSVQLIGQSETPNIFSFATSELSQDAFFAWLLSWAAPQCATFDSDLQSVAVNFTRLLTGFDDLQVNAIEAGRQWEHIDIWAKINDDIFLSIEDKTGTTIHNEQLKRYKETVDKKHPDLKKCYAYVKTGNEPESVLREVKNAGYRVVLRNDILNCIRAYSGSNAMINSYRDILEKHEQATHSFKLLPVAKWSWHAWEGFYKELEKNGIIDGSWGYVPNPSGGFLGAWWHWEGFTLGELGKGDMYLQFEQGGLCFKICPECDKSNRSTIRDKCSKALIELAMPEIHKPSRFGAGQYMTIAKVSRDALFGDGVVDLSAVIDRIKKYESLIDECCKNL